ncbi:MAG: Cof-type HAD-IIB family hydrolase [bacterium]|nr:Cof-type HAD-IIB family hydrolase [bacterium]
MQCKTFDLEELRQYGYKYVVILSEYKGKLLLSRHKERSTWEPQGGKIEPNETPLQAAKRELYEESGAINFSIQPLCDYWAGTGMVGDHHTGACGVVFTAQIESIGNMPDTEMAEVASFDLLPKNLTYPAITPVLLARQTLYVSDLDGTLLRSSQTTSDYTNAVINQLVERGMHFSYATARSSATSTIVAGGIRAEIPIIVYNGSFIIDNVTGEHLLEQYFEPEDTLSILNLLNDHKIHPLVYSFLDGKERYCYEESKINDCTKDFIGTRDDHRKTPVASFMELFNGKHFHFSCIDEEQVLRPAYEKLKESFYCTIGNDIYSGDCWLEIMPKEATKANAIHKLKKMLGCRRVVVFGDGINDVPMFEQADECYAVANAEEVLKEIATEVILSNNEDGVAKWLEENVPLKL